jgi:hypothetical protein
VIPGARVVAGALHGLVGEARRQPERGRAEAVDVVEVLAQAGDVTAVVKALVRRIEAVIEPVSLDARGVVRRIPVREAVGHHEVEGLVGSRLTRRIRGERRVGGSVGETKHLDSRPVALIVVHEAQLRGARDPQRNVLGAAVEAVGLVPAAVDRDLVLVVARGHLELRRVDVRVVRRGEGRRRAIGRPIGSAPQLVLQAARHDEGAIGGRRRLLRNEGGRAHDGDRGEGRESGAGCAGGSIAAHGRAKFR